MMFKRFTGHLLVPILAGILIVLPCTGHAITIVEAVAEYSATITIPNGVTIANKIVAIEGIETSIIEPDDSTTLSFIRDWIMAEAEVTLPNPLPTTPFTTTIYLESSVKLMIPPPSSATGDVIAQAYIYHFTSSGGQFSLSGSGTLNARLTQTESNTLTASANAYLEAYLMVNNEPILEAYAFKSVNTDLISSDSPQIFSGNFGFGPYALEPGVEYTAVIIAVAHTSASVPETGNNLSTCFGLACLALIFTHRRFTMS